MYTYCTTLQQDGTYLLEVYIESDRSQIVHTDTAYTQQMAEKYLVDWMYGRRGIPYMRAAGSATTVDVSEVENDFAG